MNNLEIESALDKAVNKAIEQGITIGTKWGVRNFAPVELLENGKMIPNPKNEWRCIGGICCPLSTVVLLSNLEEENKNIKLNVLYYICKILNVTPEWVYSFISGFDNLRIGYYSDQAAHNLGFKFRMKYIGIRICQ